MPSPLIVAAVVLASVTGCGLDRPALRRADAGNKPNVLLITLDTTRADRLGLYGYEPSRSPSLDQLGAEAIVYDNAVSTSSWTLPSHASILTGKYPMSHGARFDPKGPLVLAHGIEGPEGWRQYRARGLATDEITLASLLAGDGYRTAAVVAGPWMKGIFGLDAGFGHYDDSLVTDVVGGRAADVTDRALAWLGEDVPSRFFLFVNYYDPHGPYAPPLVFQLWLGPSFWFARTGSRDAMRSLLYDAEIEYLDGHLGRLLEGLQELGLYDDTLIVVTADHGELLGEHGKVGHGNDLTQEELHVPLIVKLPGSSPEVGRRIERVSNAGVFSMILERTGVEVPVQAMARIPPEPESPIVAETRPLEAFSKGGSWRALFLDHFKLVWNSKTGYRLHDLQADPRERVDFTVAYPELARRMRIELAELFESAPEPGESGPSRSVDPAMRRALERLGYLE